MITRTIPLGPVMANTHIVIDEASGSAAIIDAGDCNFMLLSVLEDERIKKIEYILLTHGHFDHIDGVGGLKRSFPDAKIVVHQADAPMLSDSVLSLAAPFGFRAKDSISPDIVVLGGEELPFGNSSIRVIHTPGHTEGGVTYVIDKNLYTGDTLFFGSVGRTDFPGGDFDVLNDSVCRLFDLDGDYDVYPGHDRKTTLDYERKNNNYVRWSKR